MEVISRKTSSPERMLEIIANRLATGSDAARYVPMGYIQIETDTEEAQALVPPDGATAALIIVEAQAIRYRDDGEDPTSAVGMPMMVGDTMLYDAGLSTIRFIGQVDGAIVNVCFYGPIPDA